MVTLLFMHEVRNLCERAILGDVGRLPSAVALAAVPTVVVVGKEHASTTRRHHGTLTAQTGDLAVLINLVVLDLLRLSICLLLALLASSEEREHQVKRALLLDVVVRKGAAVLKLLASENETLLIRGDSLLVLDLRLHIVDGVRRLHLKGDCLTGERFHKDLHRDASCLCASP